MPCGSDKCSGNELFVCSKYSCIYMYTIINNRSAKTSFARFRRNTQWNKQLLILNLGNASIKDIMKAEIKLKKYNKNRKRQLSCLLTMRSFIFVKNVQTALTCSVVTLANWQSPFISAKWTSTILYHRSLDEWSVALIFSFTRSRTSGSSLVFPTLTPVRAILLQAAASRKQLYCAPWKLLSNTTQHSLVLSSLFLNFHLKRCKFLWATMRPDSFVVETFRSLFNH